MKVSQAVALLKATYCYEFTIVQGALLKVRTRKTQRPIFDVVITDGEIPDDTVTYLLSEAQLLAEAVGDNKRRA